MAATLCFSNSYPTIPWVSSYTCVPRGVAKGGFPPKSAFLPGPFPRLTPTPLAIHVSMSLPGQHAMFVGSSAESLWDIQERIATIQDPSHLLCACPKLVIHQLRQGFSQLILITRKVPSLRATSREGLPPPYSPTPLATVFPDSIKVGDKRL